MLRSEVRRAGGQKEWARKSGVAPSMVSMVLTGDRPPNEKIISALKLRRVVLYERLAGTPAYPSARRPRRSGHRHRCVAYLADIARAE